MPSPRPAPKPAPAPAAATVAAPPAPAQAVTPAPSGAPEPFIQLPELPEGLSLCLTLGTVCSGDSILQTVTARLYNAAGGEVAGSGPCLLDHRLFNEAVALAVAIALGNAKGLTTAAPAPQPAAPGPAVAAPPADPAPPAAPPVASDVAHELLTQIAALPPEWQDYIAQTFAAQFGTALPSDPAALTQEQVDFTSALLPK